MTISKNGFFLSHKETRRKKLPHKEYEQKLKKIAKKLGLFFAARSAFLCSPL